MRSSMLHAQAALQKTCRLLGHSADLSRKQCCWGRGGGAGRAVGRAKAAEDLRALLMLPSRLALFQELSGLCRLGDLHRGAGKHQEYSVS